MSQGTSPGNFSQAWLQQTFNSILTSSEASITATLDALKAQNSTPTQAQMLQVQYDIQQWTFTIQLASSMQKEVADALKGVVSKF